jgi:hypothetical protein
MSRGWEVADVELDNVHTTTSLIFMSSLVLYLLPNNWCIRQFV